MGLNKQKGNMYGFVTHTWNPIKGRCPHGCEYCYMKRIWDRMEDDSLRLDEKELNVNLGSGNFIFIGSSTDMWADDIEKSWIVDVLNHIDKYPGNTYLFQTKSPEGFAFYHSKNVILGITLETNRPIVKMGRYFSMAEDPMDRALKFEKITHPRKMVTIEPILDFDLIELVGMIKDIKPEWVNIGADSGGNYLPEPKKYKILKLIRELMKFTKVINKTNLKRLLK